jgi:plasmid stabilization system protein ParE
VKKYRLVLSDAAVADVVEQAEWYVAQSGQPLANRWEKAVTSAILRVLSRPTAGAHCAFESPELHDVRRTTISGFPKHLLFYRFDAEEVFVLRIAHGARDLERLL